MDDLITELLNPVCTCMVIYTILYTIYYTVVLMSSFQGLFIIGTDKLSILSPLVLVIPSSLYVYEVLHESVYSCKPVLLDIVYSCSCTYARTYIDSYMYYVYISPSHLSVLVDDYYLLMVWTSLEPIS